MHDQKEDKRPDGSNILLDDQLDQLRSDFGDPGKLIYVRVGAVGNIACPGQSDLWVAVWDRTTSEPPTEDQFDWFERYWRCKQRSADDKRKEEDLGIPKKVRSVFNRELVRGSRAKRLQAITRARSRRRATRSEWWSWSIRTSGRASF